MRDNKNTSWEKVGKWYSKITEQGGHYYHTHVVLPGVIRLLALKPDSRVLDLACGTGVLANRIPNELAYTGIDLAPNLIEEAKRKDSNPKHNYLVADVTKPISLTNKYTHAAIILALQNMKNPEGAIANAKERLEKGGRLVIVLNHPAFRIPRQSSWGIDEANKLQYRKVVTYMTPSEIPIKAHPGQQRSAITWSYHHPISDYSAMLYRQGLMIEKIEEWVSDKVSEGKAKKQENRARAEIPLFLAISAKVVL